MTKSKKDSSEDYSDDKNQLFENLKNSIIEIKNEGYVNKGRILEIKERQNDVNITYKSRWGEIDQISIYFDEFQEIKETGRCVTMDGEIIIRED